MVLPFPAPPLTCALALKPTRRTLGRKEQGMRVGGVGREATGPGRAGGAREAARPPRAQLPQPPPPPPPPAPQKAAEPLSRDPGAGAGSREPGAAALAARSAPPAPSERAGLGGRGRRSVQGGGEGGAQAPALGRGAGRLCREIPTGLSELLQGFTVGVARHQPADPALPLALGLAGSLFSPLSLPASLYLLLISVCHRKKYNLQHKNKTTLKSLVVHEDPVRPPFLCPYRIEGIGGRIGGLDRKRERP